MSAIATTIIGGLIGTLAKEIGAPVIEKIVTKRFGKAGGELAGTIIDTIAEKVGVEPQALPGVEDAVLKEAIVATEAQTPELIAAWAESQRMALDLQKTEMDKGPLWTWAWRPGWMWFFAFLWLWALVVQPIVNAVWMLGLPSIDLAILLSLTGLFMALYMGGHTAKAIRAGTVTE